jgi:hypothetical protein
MALVAALLATTALAGCGDEPRPAPRDTARSVGSGAMTLEPLPTDPGVGDLGFRPAGAPVWLDDRRIAVGDEDAGQVVVMDVVGGKSTRMGRRGMGPGEFLYPMSLRSGDNGSLLVGDPLVGRVTELGPDGRARREAGVPGRLLSITAWRGDVVTAAWMDGQDPVLGVVDLATGTAVERVRPLSASPGVAASAGEEGDRTPFLVLAGMPDGGMLVSGARTYELFSFAADGTAGRVYAHPNPVPRYMTDEEAEKMTSDMRSVMGAAGADVVGEVMRRARARPTVFFRAGAVTVDERGRVWVVTSHRSEDATEVDVFAPDGGHLARLSVPGLVASVAPRGDRLAVLREAVGGDADGAEGLDLYRIVP